jgi:hypothetical protein
MKISHCLIATLTLALRAQAAPFTQAGTDVFFGPQDMDPHHAFGDTMDINNAVAFTYANATVDTDFHHNSVIGNSRGSWPMDKYSGPVGTSITFDYQLILNGVSALVDVNHAGVYAASLPFGNGATYTIESRLDVFLTGGVGMEAISTWDDDLTFHGVGNASLVVDLEGGFQMTTQPPSSGFFNSTTQGQITADFAMNLPPGDYVTTSSGVKIPAAPDGASTLGLLGAAAALLFLWRRR